MDFYELVDQVVGLSRRRQAKSWELRAAKSLSRQNDLTHVVDLT
jgi:hypothetical protein